MQETYEILPAFFTRTRAAAALLATYHRTRAATTTRTRSLCGLVFLEGQPPWTLAPTCRSTAAHVRTYTGGCACSGFNLLRTRTRARGQDPLAMTPLPPHICPCTAYLSACRARPPVAPRRGCVNTKIGERGSSSVLFRYTPDNGITLLPSRHRGSTPRRD